MRCPPCSRRATRGEAVSDGPDLASIRRTRERLGDRVVTTPVRDWDDPLVTARLAPGTLVALKEELFQKTGTFKPRGALSVMMDLDAAALARGVTAVSAGNHAMAVAYAAGVLGATARVVMPRTASPFRVARCREMGADVELVDDVHAATEVLRQQSVPIVSGPRTASARRP